MFFATGPEVPKTAAVGVRLNTVLVLVLVSAVLC